MTIGSGLAGSLGIGAEPTYGTAVVVTKFLDVESVGLKQAQTIVQGGGLQAAALAQPSSQRVVTSKSAAGPLALSVKNKGMGLLLQALMGTTVVPVQQGATAAYLQTHTLADAAGKSLTAQVGVPATGGTVAPYTYSGVKVLSAEFACAAGELLKATFDLDARNVTDDTALAAPSYVTGVKPFHFAQSAVKLGAFGAEASVDGVRGVSVKIDRAVKTDRYYAGAAGLKAEPIMNAWQAVTGTIDTDFVTKADWADRWLDSPTTPFSLVWEFVGATIEGTNKETFRITLPSCFVDGDTPTLDGPDVVAPSFPFSWQYDGTNLPKIEYVSTDATL